MNAYKNILLPLDFSKTSVYAAERAREIAHNYDADLIILHIINYLPPAYVAIELPAELRSKEFMLGKATSHINEWTAEHGLTGFRKIVEIGQPKKVITRVIKELAIDLVVLAPREDNSLVRLFGSVTNAVVHHNDCDVLILRDK